MFLTSASSTDSTSSSFGPRVVVVGSTEFEFKSCVVAFVGQTDDGRELPQEGLGPLCRTST
jgi:hypothetical protein